MQNETKLSPEMINSFFQLMKKGKNGQDSVRSIINQHFTEEQKKAMGQIMSDPQKMKELLSSPQAKELLEKFGGKGQGGSGNGRA